MYVILVLNGRQMHVRTAATENDAAAWLSHQGIHRLLGDTERDAAIALDTGEHVLVFRCGKPKIPSPPPVGERLTTLKFGVEVTTEFFEKHFN